MQILPIFHIDALAPHAETWDRLAGEIPFRGWTWNSTWWQHYGASRRDGWRLAVLLVLDRRERVVGLAPWYLDESSPRGRTIRFLGSGELHPDYLGVLCENGREDDVADALAQWLCDQRDERAGGESLRWDRLELTCLDASDRVVPRLAEQLGASGNTVHRRLGPSCWRVDLPGDVEDYVARLSKNSRKKFRRIQRRMLDSHRAALHQITSADALPGVMDILIDMHQRRRRMLGQPGCFASKRFTAFHRDLAQRMLVAGQLMLHMLEIDGRPAAVEYGFASAGAIYAYQSGIDTTRLDLEPGRVATTAMLDWAIANGYRAYDLMRGNEPYKSHWRPHRRDSVELRIVAPHAGAQLRHALWLAGAGARQWIKQGWGIRD